MQGQQTAVADDSLSINPASAQRLPVLSDWPRSVSLEAVATGALAPEIMGYAPVVALQKLFDATGLTPSDIDVFEHNEAFASQAVAVTRDAKLDSAKVNRRRRCSPTPFPTPPPRRCNRHWTPCGPTTPTA